MRKLFFISIFKVYSTLAYSFCCFNFYIVPLFFLHMLLCQVVCGRVLADGTSLDYRLNGNVMNSTYMYNLRSGFFFSFGVFFFRAKVGEKSGEEKKNTPDIYLFAESSAAPQLTNLSIVTSRHLGFHASIKAATGSQAA